MKLDENYSFVYYILRECKAHVVVKYCEYVKTILKKYDLTSIIYLDHDNIEVEIRDHKVNSAFDDVWREVWESNYEKTNWK